MEDVTESERRIIREPLILGHPSPHPVILLPLLYPALLDSLCLQHFIPLPHGHNSLVSADADHHGFTGQRTATRPRAKGQCFICQRSCDVSLTTEWTQGCTHLEFCVSLPLNTTDVLGKPSAFGWVYELDANYLKCHLFSYNPSGFLAVKLFWQLSTNEALVNTIQYVFIHALGAI